MQIRSLTSEMGDSMEQAAELLVLAFARYGAWTTIEEARQEARYLYGKASVMYNHRQGLRRAAKLQPQP